MRSKSQTEILQRLHSVAGHLEAVVRMVEAGRDCEEVLHQLGAVEAGLQAAGRHLLKCQAEESEALILSNPSVERRTKELKRLHSLYATLHHRFGQSR